MTKSEIASQIIQILGNVQSSSGKPAVPITGSTKPIGGLEGFDSLNGVEVTAIVSHEFGIEISETNLLVNSEGDRALSVSEVADRVSSLLSGQGK